MTPSTDSFIFIDSVYDNDVFPSEVVARVGLPFEITSDVQFETAEITFEYDESLLGATAEENLRIMWYDEANMEFVIFEDSVVDTVKNTVTCSTTHFSVYMLVDIEGWNTAWGNPAANRASYLASVQFRNLVAENDIGNKDVLISVNTGSDYVKSNIDEIKTGLKRIAGTMTETDRMGVAVAYGYEAETSSETSGDTVYSGGKAYTETLRYSHLSNSHENTVEFLSSFRQQDAPAGVDQQLKAMIELYSDSEETYSTNRGIIWISSDDLPLALTSEKEELYNEFSKMNIKVYQIYLGSNDEDYVQEKLDQIGGKCYKAGSAEEISDAIQSALVDMIVEYHMDHDVIFLVNTGAEKIKANSMWSSVIGIVNDRIISHNEKIRIGLAENLQEGKEGYRA